jgi:hypothetical protein
MSLFCDDDDELQLLLLLLCLMKSGGFPFEGATLSSSPFKDELDLVRKNVLNHPPPPPRGLKGLAFAAAGAGSAMLLMLLPRPDSCLLGFALQNQGHHHPLLLPCQIEMSGRQGVKKTDIEQQMRYRSTKRGA